VSRIFVPHDYQYPTMQFIRDNKRCGIWAPMGGGKTVCTLTALDQLTLVEDDIFPALVIAPLRVARTVWGPELEKWKHLNHLRASIITGTPKEREKALTVDAQIMAINYENVPWLVEELGDDWPFHTVIPDEFTRLKGTRVTQGAKRGQALKKVAFDKITRLIGLTGTPSPNGLKDLWGQTYFIDKGARLGDSFTAFENRWFQRGKDGYSLEPMAHAESEIHVKVHDVYITVKGLDVDEPIYNQVFVDLPDSVRKIYREMEKKKFTEIKGKGVGAANAAVKTSKLLQIANGFCYTGDSDISETKGQWEELHDAKIDALKSVIEEANGTPVLVAYNFVADLERLQKAFPNGRVLDAKPSTEADWNAGKIPILFAHPASAGHGLNLQDGGNILVFFGVDWNLENFMQIIERIGPMRQKQSGYDRPVFVHLILARHTMDLGVYDRLVGKKSVQEALLDYMKRAA
jgi:SNF2 family DNA or RNA helicase